MLSPDGRWRWDGQQWHPAVRITPHRTNHILHLLLTVFTAGLWGPIWFLIWVLNRNAVDVERQYQ